MIEKIISYYRQGPQAKYFLLKVAVSTRNNERKLVWALAITTDNKLEDLKEYFYDNLEYKEFLVDAKEFLDLISKNKNVIKIDGFKIPFRENVRVDEFFISTIEDQFKIGRPYELFRIRVDGESYSYESLSHPNHPNYPSFYPFIKEHMGFDMIVGQSVDFCIVFPSNKPYLKHFKIKRNKCSFEVGGNLQELYYIYYIKSEKGENQNKIKTQRKNSIKFKGKIREFELNLWHCNKKVDCILTRNIDEKKLSKISYQNETGWFGHKEAKKDKTYIKKILMNPWVYGIVGSIIAAVVVKIILF